MSIELQVDNGTSGHTVIRVQGEIDLATAPELATALAEAVPIGRPIILDLSKVEFIDTSGVRVMLDARRQVNDHEHTSLTVVAPPNSPSRRLLEMTELVAALAVVDTIDDATVGGT